MKQIKAILQLGGVIIVTGIESAVRIGTGEVRDEAL